MWWNGTSNIYILIFMVLCIYGSFSLSHLLDFKPFLGSLFPPKCLTEGSFELGGVGFVRRVGTKSSFPHPYYPKFDLLCVLPLPEIIFEHKHWVSCVLFFGGSGEKALHFSRMNQFFKFWDLKKESLFSWSQFALSFCVLWGSMLWYVFLVCLKSIHLVCILAFSISCIEQELVN